MSTYVMIDRSKKKYRIAIVDDHEMFSMALATLIGKYNNLELVGMFSDGQELIANHEVNPPEIILMDIVMPGIDGPTATRIIMGKYPSTRIIAVSIDDDGIKVQQMFEAGAHSFFTKQVQKKPFEDLLESVINDKRYISSSAAINYAFHMNRLAGSIPAEEEIPEEDAEQHLPHIHFTDREKQVIRFIRDGLTDKEIANVLAISARTVGSHKRHMFEKSGTRKSTELLTLAYKMKLIT